MSKLIEALQIFLKYGDRAYPTHCEHDQLTVHGYEKDEISSEDLAKLEELSFAWDEECNGFTSYRYGSC